MRKRVAESATTQMGRMGAKDTMGIPGWASEGTRLSLGLARPVDDVEHLAGCALEVVVDYNVVVLRSVLHLGLCDLETPDNIVFGNRALASLLAADQLHLRRRGHEDCNAGRAPVSQP